MPITPKPLVETESLTVRLPKEVLELLDGYCRFLGGATDRTYVVTEALRLVVSKDRRYRKAREGRKGNANPCQNLPAPRTKRKPQMGNAIVYSQ